MRVQPGIAHRPIGDPEDVRRPPWGTQTHLQAQKPAHAGSRALLGLMHRVSNILWLLFANDLPTVMFFLGPFSLLPLSFLLLVFLDVARLFASCARIVICWTPSCLFPWLLAFAGVYLSFVAIGRSSLFLRFRVGDRREVL